jgi:hypothetical protein
VNGDKPGPRAWVWIIILYFASAILMGVIIGLTAVAGLATRLALERKPTCDR